MEMIGHLQRLFAYDDWANREALASLRQSESSVSRAIRFMSHVAAAQWLWLGRLKEDETPVTVWSEHTLDQCEEQLDRLTPIWRDYLDGLTPEKLSQPVSYADQMGESWSSAALDILLQVVMHSAYHRGQIASDVRASGHAPAYSDFIHGVRQGFVA
jgi:uncharacterized damage-inducible protein DinB